MKIRLWLYKYNIFELRINKWNWEWSAQSWTLLIKAVVKMKPEKKVESDLPSNKHYFSSNGNKAWKKFRLVRELNLCDTGAVLYQQSYQANWEFIWYSYFLSRLFITSQIYYKPKNKWFPVSLLAQLVEHGTGIAEVMVPTSVLALIFFRLYFHFCLNNVCYWEDHSHFHLAIKSLIRFFFFSITEKNEIKNDSSVCL